MPVLERYLYPILTLCCPATKQSFTCQWQQTYCGSQSNKKGPGCRQPKGRHQNHRCHKSGKTVRFPNLRCAKKCTANYSTAGHWKSYKEGNLVYDFQNQQTGWTKYTRRGNQLCLDSSNVILFAPASTSIPINITTIPPSAPCYFLTAAHSTHHPKTLIHQLLPHVQDGKTSYLNNQNRCIDYCGICTLTL